MNLGAFFAGPVGSWLRVFAAGLLTAFLISLTDSANIDFAAWETWVIAGLVSVLPVVIAWLNTADPRFGK